MSENSESEPITMSPSHQETVFFYCPPVVRPRGVRVEYRAYATGGEWPEVKQTYNRIVDQGCYPWRLWRASDNVTHYLEYFVVSGELEGARLELEPPRRWPD